VHFKEFVTEKDSFLRFKFGEEMSEISLDFSHFILVLEKIDIDGK